MSGGLIRSSILWRSAFSRGLQNRGCQISLAGQHQVKHYSSSNGSETQQDSVYELRIYSIKPDMFGTFRQLMADKFHLRFPYSKPIGYWIADLGGIFQAVHIWPYESVGERGRIRQAMAVDQEWQQEFFLKFMPCLIRMDNSMMVLSPGASICTDFSPSPTAAYELLSLPADAVTPPAVSLSDQETLVGSFRTIYGDVNTEYRLMRYADPDTAFTHARKRAENNKQMRGYSRFMVPHDCSPIK